MAPILEPELKIPVARVRFFRKPRATVLIAAGKLPASPSPSAIRAAPNPNADRACCGMCHGSQTPDDHGYRKTSTSPKSVHQGSHDQQAGCIGSLKGSIDPAIFNGVPAHDRAKCRVRRYQPKHLTVDIIDRGRKKRRAADDPNAACRCGRSFRQRQQPLTR